GSRPGGAHHGALPAWTAPLRSGGAPARQLSGIPHRGAALPAQPQHGRSAMKKSQRLESLDWRRAARSLFLLLLVGLPLAWLFSRADSVSIDQHQTYSRQLLRLQQQDRKSTRLNSSHVKISYAVFCLKKKNSLTTTR